MGFSYRSNSSVLYKFLVAEIPGSLYANNRCKVGWTGEFCDECVPYPGCKMGNCSKPWECNCKSGWGGFLCDQGESIGPAFLRNRKVQMTCKRCRECQTLLNLTELNYCEANPGTCLNGGTCTSLTKEEGHFKCLCPEDYKGLQCQENKISSTISTDEKEKVVLVANESENFVKRRFG